MSRIEIVEVGPRDGLQNEKTVLTVEERLAFIAKLEAAGARRIEVVSFVNPKRVPQMAGAEEIKNRPAILDVPVGQGQVLMFATNPVYRWQNLGEFRMLYNALINYRSLNLGAPAAKADEDGGDPKAPAETGPGGG